MSREKIGIEILNKNFPDKTFRFLGEGKSSVVFTDETGREIGRFADYNESAAGLYEALIKKHLDSAIRQENK